jgi:hypothetical protein
VSDRITPQATITGKGDISLELRALLDKLRLPTLIVWQHPSIPRGQMAQHTLTPEESADYKVFYNLKVEMVIYVHPQDWPSLELNMKLQGVPYKLGTELKRQA